MKNLIKLICLLFSLVSGQLYAGGVVKVTLVKTRYGFRTIERLKTGNRVMTRDNNGEFIFKPVVAIRTKTPDSVIKISLGEESITVDPEHTFYLPQTDKWCPAKDLSPGSVLMNGLGQKILVVSSSEEKCELIDLSIEGNHNFYVSRSRILVHNFAFVIPVVTWTIGEGLAIAGGTTLTASI